MIDYFLFDAFGAGGAPLSRHSTLSIILSAYLCHAAGRRSRNVRSSPSAPPLTSRSAPSQATHSTLSACGGSSCRGTVERVSHSRTQPSWHEESSSWLGLGLGLGSGLGSLTLTLTLTLT